MEKERVLNKKFKVNNDEFLIDLLKGYIYNKGDNDDQREELGVGEEDDEDDEYEIEEEDSDD